MPKKSSGWASLLGHTVAYVQDGVDWAVDLGFTAMKKAGSAPDKKMQKDENQYVYKAKKLGKVLMKFMGTMGDEYYKKYEELKREKKKD